MQSDSKILEPGLRGSEGTRGGVADLVTYLSLTEYRISQKIIEDRILAPYFHAILSILSCASAGKLPSTDFPSGGTRNLLD